MGPGVKSESKRQTPARRNRPAKTYRCHRIPRETVRPNNVRFIVSEVTFRAPQRCPDSSSEAKKSKKKNEVYLWEERKAEGRKRGEEKEERGEQERRGEKRREKKTREEKRREQTGKGGGVKGVAGKIPDYNAGAGVRC